MLSAAIMFWRYEVYADIVGGSPKFLSNFHQIYVHPSPQSTCRFGYDYEVGNCGN